MKLLKATCLAFAVILLTSLPGQARVYELSLSLGQPAASDISKELEAWTEDLARRSNGELRVTVYPGGSLVKQPDVPKALKSGSIDIGSLATGNFSVTPYTSLNTMPFLFDNSEHAARGIMAMLETPECEREIGNLGKVIALYSSAPAVLISNGPPILSLEDLKGKRVIVYGESSAAEIKAWGGVPVVVDLTEIYVGFQRGMGDIVYTNEPGLVSYKLVELAKNVTRVPSLRTAALFVVNRDSWDGLPETLQSLLTEKYTLDGVMALTNVVGAAGQRGIDDCLIRGIGVYELSDVNRAAFQQAAQSAISADYRNNLMRAGVNAEKAGSWLTTVFNIADSIR